MISKKIDTAPTERKILIIPFYKDCAPTERMETHTVLFNNITYLYRAYEYFSINDLLKEFVSKIFKR